MRHTVHVSKVQLMSPLHEALGGGRLKHCRRGDGRLMENSDVLERELAAFRVRTSDAGHQVFGAEQRDHDDCVISVAMPLWLSSRSFMALDVEVAGSGEVIEESPDLRSRVEAQERRAVWMERNGVTSERVLKGEESAMWFDDPRYWEPY